MLRLHHYLVVLLLLVLFALLKAKKGKMLFAAPIIGVLGVSVVTGMDPRIRYILPVYPFLAVVAAVGVKEFRASLSARSGVYGSLVLGVLFVWYAGGALLQYPHFISYANEFVPHAQRYMYFTDSNIDWGQALPDIKLYINEHKSSHVSFSYFGRDNGNDYGLVSNREWGSYRFEEICAFHEISLPYHGDRLVAISVSNWYGCGHSKQSQFSRENVQDVVGDSILIFILFKIRCGFGHSINCRGVYFKSLRRRICKRFSYFRLAFTYNNFNFSFPGCW